MSKILRRNKIKNISRGLLSSLIFTVTILIYQNCGDGFAPIGNDQLASKESVDLLILKEPYSRTGYINDSVVFTALAQSNNADTIIYQWKKDGVNLQNETSSSLILTNIQPIDAGMYSLLIKTVTDSQKGYRDIELETSAVSLQINAQPSTATPIQVQLLSESQSLALGSFTVLRAQVTGYPRPSLQWYKDDTSIVGENQDFLTLTDVTLNTEGLYHLEASNNNSSELVKSDPLLVAVDQQNIAPYILNITPEQNLAAGSQVDLKVSAVGIETPSYQWSKDDIPMTGETKNSLLISQADSNDSGLYKVLISNSAGSAEGQVQVNIVNDLQEVQGINNQMVAQNANVTFSYVVNGQVNNYEWYKDNTLIPNETNPTLSVPNVSSNDAGIYRVRANNLNGFIESTATLTVVTPPLINIPLSNQTPNEGDNVTFTAQATGIGLTYQWYKDSQLIQNQNQPNLNLNNLNRLDSAQYRVDVTNIAGTTPTSANLNVNLLLDGVQLYARECSSCHGALNNSAKFNRTFSEIKVAMSNTFQMQGPFQVGGLLRLSDTQIQAIAGALSLGAPQITSHPQSQTVTMGQMVTFNVQATGQYLSYQWRKGGVNITNATSASYFINSVDATHVGNYDVVVSNPAGTIISNLAQLTLGAAPLSVVYFPAGQCSTGKLELYLSGNPHPTYQFIDVGDCVRVDDNIARSSLEVRCIDPTNTMLPSDFIGPAITSAANTTASCTRIL